MADEDLFACAQNLYLALVEIEEVGGDEGVKGHGEAGFGCKIGYLTRVVDCDASGVSQVVLEWDVFYTAVDLSLGIVENKSEFNLEAGSSSCL